jgi:hypothetical protein
MGTIITKDQVSSTVEGAEPAIEGTQCTGFEDLFKIEAVAGGAYA